METEEEFLKRYTAEVIKKQEKREKLRKQQIKKVLKQLDKITPPSDHQKLEAMNEFITRYKECAGMYGMEEIEIPDCNSRTDLIMWRMIIEDIKHIKIEETFNFLITQKDYQQIKHQRDKLREKIAGKEKSLTEDWEKKLEIKQKQERKDAMLKKLKEYFKNHKGLHSRGEISDAIGINLYDPVSDQILKELVKEGKIKLIEKPIEKEKPRAEEREKKRERKQKRACKGAMAERQKEYLETHKGWRPRDEIADALDAKPYSATFSKNISKHVKKGTFERRYKAKKAYYRLKKK